MRSFPKRVIALLLPLAFLAVSFRPLPVHAKDATEVQNSNSAQYKKDDLQNQLDELETYYEQLANQQAAIKKEIANASSLKNQQLAVKKNIDGQIALTQQQITLLENKISLLEETIAITESSISETEAKIQQTEAMIAEKEQAIVDKQNEYDDTYRKFLQRLRILYMNGSTTELELLFSAESYSDMLAISESRKRIADHDRALMIELAAQKLELEASLDLIEDARTELEDSRNDLEKIRADLEKRYASLDTSRSKLEEMKAELDEQVSVAEALASEYAAKESQASQKQAEILAAMQSAKAEMNTIFAELAKLSNMSEYVGGTFQWPLPGYTMITSSFGESRSYYANGRWMNDVHTGTDISGSGVYGKPIIAANNGVVYTATWSNYGYGNYIILDHGGGVNTLYAHCSNLIVEKGQTVVKGDIIGYVGSSGNSTGAHLHFEVRVDGKAVNPMQYFTKV